MNQQNRFAGIPDESGTMASGISLPFLGLLSVVVLDCPMTRWTQNELVVGLRTNITF
jgi:hypothetical protein